MKEKCNQGGSRNLYLDAWMADGTINEERQYSEQGMFRDKKRKQEIH